MTALMNAAELSTRLAVAEAEVTILRQALAEALDEFADAIPYIDEYFDWKWGYTETVKRLREVLAPTFK